MGKSTISMAIFNSYVKLPEGNQQWDLAAAQLTLKFGAFKHRFKHRPSRLASFACSVMKYW